jgi:hypothetical protein
MIEFLGDLRGVSFQAERDGFYDAELIVFAHCAENVVE